MADSSFLKGTLILGLSGIAVKFLSAVYRIPLTRMIGARGMGQYTAAFNFFMPFFSLATAGITPAISRLCASGAYSGREIHYIKKKACRCFGYSSLALAAAALVARFVYSDYTASPMIFTGVALLAPNLVFATFEAVYKGISQGTMNMAVSAKAGLIESSCKTVIGICSVYLAGTMLAEHRRQGQLVRAFATVSISGFVCFVYMSTRFRNTYRERPADSLSIGADRLFSMAVPISLSALVVSVSNFCDTVICLSIIKSTPDRRLMAAYPFIGFSAVEEKAIWLYGVYQGLCLSVVNLIPSLSAAVGASGLPFITRAIGSGDGSRAYSQISRTVKITAAVVVPASLFVAFFSREVLITLYGENGAQTELAAYFLRIMAPFAVLSAFSFPLNSIIHARGKTAAVFRILVFSCTVKVILSVILCSVEDINIMGCLLSQIVFHSLVFLLSLNTIKNVYPAAGIFRAILFPAVVSYVMLSFVRALSEFVLYNVPVVFRTVFCGGIFLAVYFCMLLFTGFFIDNLG